MDFVAALCILLVICIRICSGDSDEKSDMPHDDNSSSSAVMYASYVIPSVMLYLKRL